MSNELRDLFKKELDRIPLRPADTWVPRDRQGRLGGSPWRVPLALLAAGVVLVAALIGGRELANLRDRTSAAGPGVVAGKAIYLSPSFNGSGWVQIDPVTLQDLSATPLLDIAATSSNSFDTQVSQDGSTIIVGDYTNGAKWTIYDARTGRARGPFVPEIRIVGPDYISADSKFAMGRLATAQGAPVNSDRAIVSLQDGRLVRRVAAVSICCIQAAPAAPDLSAVYFVTTPAEIGFTSQAPMGLQPYSLLIQHTATGALSAPIALPGITGGTIMSFGSPSMASSPTTMRPAIAFSDDGRRLAVLSFDGQTLDIVDTNTLAVTTVKVHPKTSLLDVFGRSVAAAKTLNDEVRIAMTFTPDGQSVLTYSTATHYDDLTGVTRTTRGMQRIEIATGLIAAESAAAGAIFDFRVTPDGSGLLVVARTQEVPPFGYVLRRFDTRTLELGAERQLADYAELKILVAPQRN
jgi:hypothetical protein